MIAVGSLSAAQFCTGKPFGFVFRTPVNTQLISLMLTLTNVSAVTYIAWVLVGVLGNVFRAYSLKEVLAST